MIENEKMIIVYTTFSNEEAARKLGRELIDKRLAACINIIPKTLSIYRWNETIEETHECIMLVKTQKSLLDILFKNIRERHSYSVPALFSFMPEQISDAYLSWIVDQTQFEDAISIK